MPTLQAPSRLCRCGCGEATKLSPDTVPSRGLVRGKPYRYIAGHQSRLSPVEYIVDKKTGCWVWQRAKTSAGYGEIGVNGKQLYAHRVYYERAHGAIPLGKVIDHLCRNTSCVNPSHLEAVEQHINSWRGVKPKLSPQQVSDIRQLARESHLSYAAIAKRYGVSTTCISAAIRGNRWSRVPGSWQPGRRRLIDLRKTTIETLREIVRLCKSKAMTQRRIAKQFGLSEAYVSQIATGHYAECLS